MAGIANLCSWAYLKRARTSSPTMTPVFLLRTSWAPMIAVVVLICSGKLVRNLLYSVMCTEC